MSRMYPDRPVVGVLAVLWKDGRVLLVQRANPPDQGKWGFPGGRQHLGETVEQAALRELHEETGVIGEAIGAFAALDAIHRDEAGAVRYHYTLVAVAIEWRAGEPVAADDALAVAWRSPEAVGDESRPLCAQVDWLVAMSAKLREARQSAQD
jgi:ADP-ribose pyrophosphatase YjhB (NUDIX family)